MIRPFVKLCWLVVLGTGRIIRLYLGGDRRRAVEEARLVAIVIHDDFVQLAAALQRLLRFRPSPDPNIDRILIVKLDRIGDMVCTTPVFDALKASFPKARLDVVGHPVPLRLLTGDERIGERIPYASSLYHEPTGGAAETGRLSVVLRILRRRYPLVVYLRGSFPFLLLGTTSHLAAAKFVKGEPVITRYLKPVEQMVGPISHRQPRLHVDPDARHLVERLLAVSGKAVEPRIAIHAVAGAVTKMWPIERYAAVADELHQSYHASIHFFGSPGDRPVLEKIAGLCKYSHSYHYALGLDQVVAAFSVCDVFIGNDSGLAHVAAGVGTPIVVPWGSVNLEMAQPTAPAGRRMILYRDVPCRATCPETHCVNEQALECLTRITVGDVVDAARQVLARRTGVKHESALSRA